MPEKDYYTNIVAGSRFIRYIGDRRDNMDKKAPKKMVSKDTKSAKPDKKEVQEAARKKLMDLKEC